LRRIGVGGVSEAASARWKPRDASSSFFGEQVDAPLGTYGVASHPPGVLWDHGTTRTKLMSMQPDSGVAQYTASPAPNWFPLNPIAVPLMFVMPGLTPTSSPAHNAPPPLECS